ncbi:MAG TPA: LON peptidase substrate-binding domain-containing protein, partial [Candidatus Faecaligallichristensenella faecipullorum]|nr:LON peptidase substrate-binding domain-containing protein [Candidatus Faecaligallichristensenella faecipullorum]
MSNDLIASSSEMLPLLPLRGIALFPGIMVHFDVGREKSILALEKAMESDQRLFVVAQRKFSTEDPFLDDLYSVGTVLRVRQVVKLPDGVFRVLADGESRALLLDAHLEEGHLV